MNEVGWKCAGITPPRGPTPDTTVVGAVEPSAEVLGCLPVRVSCAAGAEEVQLRQRHQEDHDRDENDQSGQCTPATSGEPTALGAPLDRLGRIEHVREPGGVLCRLPEELIEVVRALVHCCHLLVTRRASDSIWDASVVRARWIQERTVPGGAFISWATSSTVRSNTTCRTKARR